MFRKKLMNPVFFDSRQPSSKFLQQIYRPTVHQETRRRPTPTRSHTKESLNQSKERKKTQPKQSVSQTELRRGTNGSSSARKIIVSETIHSASKAPLRASSSTNLKSRSLSSQSVSAAASLTSSNKKQSPIEIISRYGSSNLKEKKVEQKVQEAISKKLTLRMGWIIIFTFYIAIMHKRRTHRKAQQNITDWWQFIYLVNNSTHHNILYTMDIFFNTVIHFFAFSVS